MPNGPPRPSHAVEAAEVTLASQQIGSLSASEALRPVGREERGRDGGVLLESEEDGAIEGQVQGAIEYSGVQHYRGRSKMSKHVPALCPGYHLLPLVYPALLWCLGSGTKMDRPISPFRMKHLHSRLNDVGGHLS